MTPRYIVAEISKVWTKDSPPTDTLAQRFEQIIGVNLERGYQLSSWKLVSVVTGFVEEQIITETIIAVFEATP